MFIVSKLILFASVSGAERGGLVDPSVQKLCIWGTKYTNIRKINRKTRDISYLNENRDVELLMYKNVSSTF